MKITVEENAQRVRNNYWRFGWCCYENRNVIMSELNELCTDSRLDSGWIFYVCSFSVDRRKTEKALGEVHNINLAEITRAASWRESNKTFFAQNKQ